MRIGATIFNQNYTDWDRYLAEEQGEGVPARAAKPDREIFREELGLAMMAEDLGFDSVWTIEHHFTPYTMVTNPIQYLTYLAGVTKRVDLGTMVVVLPWHNPVRVAEDYAMLDTFLGPDRKAILGVGRGLGRREFEGLGIDQNEARGRFDEAIEVVQQLLRTGECKKFDGQYFQVKDVRIRPQLERDLSDNLWCAGGSEQSVQIIAEKDVNPLIVPTTTLEAARAVLEKYSSIRAARGKKPIHSKLALWTYVHEDLDAADRAAKQYLVEYAKSGFQHYELGGDHLKHIKGYESYGKMADMMAQAGASDAFLTGFYHQHPWGTPERVIEGATRLAEGFGTNELMFIFKYGSMPIEQAKKSMELFAKEVMPELKKLNPPPITPAAVEAVPA